MRKGLIGKKLGHSFSKLIHEDLRDYQYDLIELKEDELEKFFMERNFKALNVTVPYKKEVLKYADFIDKQCEVIGASNTIVNRGGKLYCYNTDYNGFEYMLNKHQVNLQDKKVCILGNGGAAQAVKAVIRNSSIRELVICKRNISDETITYEELYEKHQDADILINTSSVGMYPANYDELVDLDKFDKLEWVIDIIYNPLKTKLLVDAEEKEINIIGGLEMLIAQAVVAIEYFEDSCIDRRIIDDYYQKLYKEKQNLVLIGMPGCGKSTIGEKLASELNKEFIDIDSLIEKNIQMTIKEYFDKYNEKKFRDKEKDITKETAKLNSKIISTGGGIILDEENIMALKQNGLLIYLKRDIEKLAITADRPLSKDLEAVNKLYQQRYPLYEKYADIIIDNNDCLEVTIRNILEKQR